MFHESLLAAGRICFGAMAAFLLCGTATAAAISVNSLADNVFVNVTGQTFSDAAYTVAVTPAYCTLRMAISSANRDAATGGCAAGSGADFITFSPSLNLGTTPGTITLADVAMNTSPYPLPAGLTNPPPLFVAKALTITGPGSTQLTIDGSLAAVSGRRIIAAADFDDTALFPFALSGVRLLRGRVIDGQGGCLVTSETLSLNDVTFESCEAVSGANNSGYGGALNVGVDSSISSNTRPDVSINNSLFIGNRATHGSSNNRSEGGAAGIGGSGNWVGNVTLTNTVVNGNSADTRGGMLIGNAISVTISGSQFVANSSTGSNVAGTSGRHGGFLISGVSGNVTLSGGTRINGNVANEERGGFGIYDVGGTVTLNQVDVIGNYVNRGTLAGADILTNSACDGSLLRPVNLTNVTIQSNSAAGQIGGIRIACSGAVTLTDVAIVGNESRGYRLLTTDVVTSGLAAASLGLNNFSQFTMTLNRVLVQGNKTRGLTGGPGGIVRVRGPSAFSADSLRFLDNSVEADNGFILSAGLAGSNYLITNSEFSGNSARKVAALLIEADGNYTVRNTTIAGNRAAFNGIVTANANTNTANGINIAIEHSTFARNTSAAAEALEVQVAANSPNASAAFGLYSGANTAVTVKNSILGARSVGYTSSSSLAVDPGVSNVVATSTLLEWPGGAPAAVCSGAGMKCNLSSLLTPLADNGGSAGIRTMALIAGSPAINAGGAVSAGVTTDARGAGFPRVVGSAVDIGAFESAPATTLGCTLDVDGNGSVDALTDGLMVIRALFGLTGTAVTNGALAASPTRADWSAIRGYINANCGTNFAP